MRDPGDLSTAAVASGPALPSQKVAKGASARQDTAPGDRVFGQRPDIVVSCSESTAPSRLYAVNLHGFGTRAAEKGVRRSPLGEVGDAVTSFQQRISSSDRAQDVVPLTHTSLGRRGIADVDEGTDHSITRPVFAVEGPPAADLVG